MKIFVTRHGQTSWNALNKIQGQTDIELNDVGREQAKLAGEKIKNETIDLIIASPLKRTMETAKIINENFNVEIITDERIKERSYGENEGLTKDEIRALKSVNPDIEDVWNYEKNVCVNGIEPIQTLFSRVYDFLDEITDKYKDKRILVVTHGGTTIPIKCYFSDYPVENIKDGKDIGILANCEVAEFELH